MAVSKLSNEQLRLDAAQALIEEAQKHLSVALLHVLELKKEKGYPK